MLFAQCAALDRQRFREEWFGARIQSHAPVEQAEVVDRNRDFRVIVPEETLPCGQRLDQQGLGLCISSAPSQDLGQMAHRPARGYVFFSTRCDVQVHGSLELPLRLFEQPEIQIRFPNGLSD